jgi:hypothetical protein
MKIVFKKERSLILRKKNKKMNFSQEFNKNLRRKDKLKKKKNKFKFKKLLNTPLK